MAAMEKIVKSRVCDLVTESPSRASVLTRYSIDFCCGGRSSLTEVCQEKELDLETVANEIIAHDEMLTGELENSVLDLNAAELCDYIEEKHHTFLRTHLPVALQHAMRVAQVHGGRNPTLITIARMFEGLKHELEMHLLKEENVLFPLIREMTTSGTMPESHCGSVKNPIRAMFMEHHNAGNVLSRLRQLTNDYTPPEDACNTYRALFAELEMIESDTHMHIHLENHVLFVKAQELERDICESEQ